MGPRALVFLAITVTCSCITEHAQKLSSRVRRSAKLQDATLTLASDIQTSSLASLLLAFNPSPARQPLHGKFVVSDKFVAPYLPPTQPWIPSMSVSESVGGQVLELALAQARTHVAFQFSKFCAADVLLAADGSPSMFAQQLGLEPSMSLRFLRTAASLGLVVEDEVNNTFVPSELGRRIGGCEEPERGVMRLEASPEYLSAWDHFEEVLRTGKKGWHLAHGQPRIYDSITQEGGLPQFGQVFYEGLRSWGRMEEEQILMTKEIKSLIEQLPAESTIVDVGGGEGSFAARILDLRPDIHVTVQDQQVTIEAAKRNPALEPWIENGRLKLVSRSFFDGVEPGHLFLCKYVLHNWGDEDSKSILSGVRTAMTSQTGAKLLIIEHGPLDSSPEIRLLDLHMAVLCGAGGKERSTAEYTHLIQQSGLAVHALHRSAGAVHAIECAIKD